MCPCEHGSMTRTKGQAQSRSVGMPHCPMSFSSLSGWKLQPRPTHRWQPQEHRIPPVLRPWCSGTCRLRRSCEALQSALLRVALRHFKTTAGKAPTLCPIAIQRDLGLHKLANLVTISQCPEQLHVMHLQVVLSFHCSVHAQSTQKLFFLNIVHASLSLRARQSYEARVHPLRSTPGFSWNQ